MFKLNTKVQLNKISKNLNTVIRMRNIKDLLVVDNKAEVTLKIPKVTLIGCLPCQEKDKQFILQLTQRVRTLQDRATYRG